MALGFVFVRSKYCRICVSLRCVLFCCQDANVGHVANVLLFWIHIVVLCGIGSNVWCDWIFRNLVVCSKNLLPQNRLGLFVV